MGVVGQVLNAFSIEDLPDTDIEFQVVVESTIRVIGIDGSEKGHCRRSVISKPVRLKGSSDASEMNVTDWTQYLKEDSELTSSGIRENLVDRKQQDNQQYSQLNITCSLIGIHNYRNDHTVEKDKEENIPDFTVNETKDLGISLNFEKALEGTYSVSGNFLDECISRNSSADGEVSKNDKEGKVLHKDSSCYVSDDLQDNIVNSEHAITELEKKNSGKTRTSRRKISGKKNKGKRESSKARKRKKLCEDVSKVKLKKMKIELKEKEVVLTESIKAEPEGNLNTGTYNNDGGYLSDYLSDMQTDTKIESDLNKNDSDISVNSNVQNKEKKQRNLRKRSAVTKSFKLQNTKKIKNSKKVRGSKNSVEGVEIDTEEMDPKLIYAKMSLERQKLMNSKRIRVELENYKDRFRTTIVESMAQRDRGKSFEEKSYQSYECTICGRFQSTVQEKIRFHIEQHINGELECKKCGYILSYRKEISRHNNEVHTADVVNQRVCELCGITASSYRMWKAHMSKVHKVPSFKCKHCSEKFFNAAEVVVHTRENHKDIILTCDKCGQVFVSRGNWSYHSVRCNGTANSGSFVCDQCGKDLNSAIALKRHIRHYHEMEKTHKCSLCSYATHTIARLQKHMNAHLGNKQYHCELCQFSSVQKYQLTSHMRVHTGEKPFRCDQCPYAVAWNVQLKAHKKVHDLTSAVACKTCQVVFRDAKTLSKHEQKDHGIKVNSSKTTESVNDPVSNIPVLNSSVNNCITGVSNEFGVSQGLFAGSVRSVGNGINEILPNVGDMMDNNVRNHINQLENGQLQLSAQIPLYSFSYQ